jgi:hypothetical protein
MPPPAWGKSPAKAKLIELYRDKHSWIHLCLPQQIYDTEPLFNQYPWNNFRNNFNRLMDTIDREEECVAFDQAAFEHYRSKKPRAEQTVRGEPFYDGHRAQALLKAFVKQQDQEWKEKSIERKKLPAEVYALNAAYREFSLPTFRNHYYREMRALREEVYWQKKRNRDGQKKQTQLEDQQEEE